MHCAYLYLPMSGSFTGKLIRFQPPVSLTSCERFSAITTAPPSPDCPKCVTFRKSGQHSCCAPGGAWFRKCGRESSVGRTWAEGVRACKRKCQCCCSACWCVFCCQCPHTITISAKGSPLHEVRHLPEIRQTQLLRSWGCLVQELRRQRQQER